MRKITIFFILFFAAAMARAQDSYSYAEWGLGVFAGINHPYVDVKKGNIGPSFSLDGYYNASPYVPIGLEIQGGDLSGGSIVTDPHKRQFDNRYLAVYAHIDFAIGEIVDYEANPFLASIKDFYVGTGVGLIKNHMKFIQRYNLEDVEFPVGTYRYPGLNDSKSFAIPLRFGYELRIYDNYGMAFMGLNFQYIHNFTFNEELDGYADPSSVFKNNAPDQYTQFQIGLKFNLGPEKPYLKRINY